MVARRVGLACCSIAAVLAALLSAAPAQADGFFLSYRSGYRPHHHHHYPYWRPGYYYGPPVTYYAPPVYYPPPPVVYAPPPVYAPQPMIAAPNSPVYRAPNGQYCREYQSTVSVAGAPQPSYGTACLQPDGAWRIVN